MIISASRRTDIPACYPKWFLNRLREGFVLVRNPVVPSRISRVPLTRDKVSGIVFWTKDAAPLMPYLDDINAMGYPYYFQFTITPYGSTLEPGLRKKSKIIETFCTLAEQLGKCRVRLRYDPIVLNKTLTTAYHMQKFERILKQLDGCTDVCTISFVDPYKKLRPLYQSGILREITQQEKQELASVFYEIGRQYHIEVRACCEADVALPCACCVDGALLHGAALKPAVSQREGCSCVQSTDIGMYDTCQNGCIYCYANTGKRAVENHTATYDEHNPLLCSVLKSTDRIYNKK